MINVEQAVYGSAQSRTMRGYHMLAQSPGINDALAAALVSWAPTRAGMSSDCESFESMNAFIVMEDWLVVSRSVYGRPEYSQRGELEVATRFLVTRHTQLEGYDFNPLWFARTALSLGHLRMYTEEQEDLNTIFLPKEPLIGVTSPPLTTRGLDHLLRAVEELRRGRQVVLVGVEDERAALAFVLSRFHSSERVQLSFTTGLFPSNIRPFQLHFLPTEAYKESRGHGVRDIVYIDASDGALVAG